MSDTAGVVLAHDSVTATERDGVLLITLNRPRTRNAINQALTDGLCAAVERLDADDRLRVGVLSGTGGYFCAGLDLKAFASAGLPRGLGRLIRTGSPRKPLIAAVTGGALAGGLELALACDLVVASADAMFGIPEARVGLVAAGGGLIRLPQRLPLGVAMEMALTGLPIPASRAHELGLVNRLCETHDGALEAALELAAAITQCAPLSVTASRAVIRGGQGRPEEEQWELQKSLVSPVLRSSDAMEGARSFAEKRAPRWTAT